jgi:hypothetical protein
MSNYLQEAIKDLTVSPVPPALKPLENEFKQNWGLEPQEVLNMVLIMSIINNLGISVQKMDEHKLLLINLCMESDFSTTDDNINHIVNALRMRINYNNNL